MQLIEEYEKTNRTFYGGAIGFMDFEGNFNHAIMI
jgi:anthranilate synthase component 1